MKKIIAIILASGQGKRMGQNKLLLNFHGKPLVQWVIEKVRSIEFKEIILVYKDDCVKAIGKKYGLHTIYNEKSYLGQSQGIKIALSEVSKSSKGFMFFTGDQPLLREDTIKKLVKRFNENGGIIVPRVNGENKIPTIFSSEFYDELMELQGDIGGRPVIKNNLDKVTFVSFDSSNEFFDIDTKEDFKVLSNNYISKEL